MKIGITGHTYGIGKAIFEMYPDSIGWSRSNGYDINKPDKIIRECKILDVVINNAHDGFAQIPFLYKLTNSFNGKIINIEGDVVNVNFGKSSKKIFLKYLKFLN